MAVAPAPPTLVRGRDRLTDSQGSIVPLPLQRSVKVTFPSCRKALGVAPTACRAWKAITIPAPESRSTPAASISSAEDVSPVRTWAGVSAKLDDNNRPAIAAACGAAAEVPKNGLNPGVATATPSAAAMSGFCRKRPPVEETLPGVISLLSGL